MRSGSPNEGVEVEEMCEGSRLLQGESSCSMISAIPRARCFTLASYFLNILYHDTVNKSSLKDMAEGLRIIGVRESQPTPNAPLCGVKANDQL